MKKILWLEPQHLAAIDRMAIPEGEKLTIGRTDRSEYGIPFDSYLSSVHFEVEYDRSGGQIRDLDSRNGTWVNGARIDVTCPLRDGDQITAGMTVFRVRFGNESDPPGIDDQNVESDDRKTGLLSSLNPFRKSGFVTKTCEL